MSARRVVVVGGGLAGTAAAWAAARAGAEVTLVSRGAGASALTSGAVDDAAWEQALEAPAALGADLEAFVAALGVWEVGPARACVATSSGVLRATRGHDRAVLDLASLGRGKVLVPRVDRAGWDADALARAFDAHPSAFALGLRFVAVDAPALLDADWAAASDIDVASHHDDAAALASLAARLRELPGLAAAAGVLLGPWLGAAASCASALVAALGKPAGEVVSPAGGPAGTRLEAACARLVASAGVSSVAGRAVRAEAGRVTCADGSALEADAVVLAVGGLVGGGLALGAAAPLGDDGEPRYETRAPFVLTLDAPAPLRVGGRALVETSAAWGMAGEALAWSTARGGSWLERAGVALDASGRVEGAAGAWLLAAGECVADAPRTVLAAARAGLRAGTTAAQG